MEKRIDLIINRLKEKNIKPSIQRIKILDYLVGNKSHPSVEKIYTNLASKIPTLSKTTVYNTLKLFANNGLVLSINIEDNEVRYDADTTLHGHFKCKCCKNIFDFNINSSEFIENELKNFSIEEHHIYVKGVCRDCNKKTTN